MKTSVVITLLDDWRVFDTIASLLNQIRKPDEIIIADGGSNRELLDELHNSGVTNMKIYVLPGSVAETRNKVLKKVKGDIIAFIDADEIAPPLWLQKLTRPIEKGYADFTGGGTRPLYPPKTKIEKFVADFDKWFYENVVKHDITALPMGNSAWKMEIFNVIGGFDENLKWGGEDYDINLRAVQAGFRGIYVKGAWVWHDQSHLNTIWKVIKKKYRYSVGATVAYLKNNAFSNKRSMAIKTSVMYKHPIEFLNLGIKAIAFIKGWYEWKKIES